MAGEERVDTYSRLNYYNGLFLKAADFEVEQAFHRMTKQYINYLLFNPGRLYHPTPFGEPEVSPLQIEEVEDAPALTVGITPGAALIRDEAQQRAYEVHLSKSVEYHQYNLADYISDSGSPTDVHIWVDWDEEESEVVGEDIGGPAGVQVSPTHNRWTEQAVIHFIDVPSGEPPESVKPTETSILLGTVANVNIAENSIGSISNTIGRGGIRYEILSSNLREKIDGVGPSPALTGITIDAAGPLALSLGASQTLSATGTFSDSSTRPLTVADDGLVWSSDDDTVVSVTTGGTITAEGSGSAVITAEAGGQSATITVNVVSLVDFTIAPAGPINLTIGETVTLVATGQFSDSSSRVLTAGDGLSWVSEDTSVATVSSGGLVTAVSGGAAMITATIDTISHAVSVTIIPTPELLYSIPGEPILPFNPNGGPSGTPVQIFGRNFVDPVVQIVELGPDSESTTDDTVLNTFNVVTIDDLSSGGIDYQRINATVGGDISTDQVGRLRVINDNGRAGNVTSTINFVLTS